MLILLHVIIAITSLIATTVLAFFPSRRRMHMSYGLIIATLVSGTYLVISLHSPLLSSCVTGLVYLTVALSGVGVAHYRLAAAKATNQD